MRAPWWRRLAEEAIATRGPDFDLVYHVSLAPALPREYAAEDLVAITFRWLDRRGGGFVFATAIDPAAAVRLGRRLGLDEAESVALVDSHERVHVFLQLAGVDEHEEEAAARVVDAVWVALHHPHAAAFVRTGEFGLVTRIGEEFWEAVVGAAVEGRPPPQV